MSCDRSDYGLPPPLLAAGFCCQFAAMAVPILSSRAACHKDREATRQLPRSHQEAASLHPGPRRPTLGAATQLRAASSHPMDLRTRQANRIGAKGAEIGENRCRRLRPLDGKEGVDGSSPSEGFAFPPAQPVIPLAPLA